jgi:hypothetical protein
VLNSVSENETLHSERVTLSEKLNALKSELKKHVADVTLLVSFHTFSLLEDRCLRLLVKNLGRYMPEGVVREELE